MGVLSDFRKFALRGNLIDMAVGFTVGAAFTTIAKSLVEDIIMPPIGYLLGGLDFSKLQYIIKDAAEAKDVVAIRYGNFINNLIAFMLVTIAMFLLIRMMNTFEAALDSKFGTPAPPGEPTEKKCQFCRTTIPYQAVRCPNCTSELSKV